MICVRGECVRSGDARVLFKLSLWWNRALETEQKG